MSIPPEVRRLLRRTARALAWRRALAWGTTAALAVSVASLLMTLAKTALPLSWSPVLALVIGLLAVEILVLAAALLPFGPPERVARLVDARLSLGERTSTALDLVAGRIPQTTLAPRILEDAAAAARHAVTSWGFPIRPPVRIRWTALAATAALLAGLVVPGLTLPGTPARETALQIKREGRRLEQVGRRVEQQARAQRVPEARRVAPQVSALARNLQRDRLERTEALARLGALERQLDAVRRQIRERIQQTAPPRAPGSLPDDLFRPAPGLDRSIKQLREIAARLAQEPTPQGERQDDLLRQLAELSQSGEGSLPTEARRKIEEARRELESGRPDAGGQALTDALAELEGLRALVADDEALRGVQREVEQSAERIARGPGGGAQESETGAEQQQPAQSAPGANRPEPREDVGGAPPPEGPNEGSTAGQGKTGEKLGAPTSRLGVEGERSRVRGQGDRGGFSTSEILGPGRERPVQTRRVVLAPSVTRRAEAFVERARIPADLRGVVRRYFELLGRHP